MKPILSDDAKERDGLNWQITGRMDRVLDGGEGRRTDS